MFRQVIYYFVSVVEEGSFSKAGKKHYLSQSAISQQITKLEKELGFTLFNRESYYPTLTNEGKQFYELSKKLINQYDKEINDIKENIMKRNNTINIGITGMFEKKHIPVIIKKYKEKYNININIKVYDLKTIMNHLVDKQIDIAFGLSNNFRNHDCLEYYDIYKSHVCVVTSLDHPLTNNKSISVQDIKNEPLIVLSKELGEEYYHDYMEAFKLDGIVPHIVKEVDNQNEFIMAISLGEGIGLSATEVIDDDHVKTILLKNTHHHADYAVGYHKDNDKVIVLDFINEVRTYFKNYNFLHN